MAFVLFYRGPRARCDDLLDGPGRDQDDEGERDCRRRTRRQVALTTVGEELEVF